MKIRILPLCILFVTTLHSCQTEHSKTIENKKAGIDTLLQFVSKDEISPAKRMVLERNYKNLMKELCESNQHIRAESVHHISEPIFTTIRRSFSIQQIQGKKESYGRLKNFTDSLCRENYVTFIFCPTYMSNADIRISKTPVYDMYGSCYSMPLFKGIAAKYDLSDTAVFTFYKVKERIGNDTNICIAFSVFGNDGIMHYYNISQDPTK